MKNIFKLFSSPEKLRIEKRILELQIENKTHADARKKMTYNSPDYFKSFVRQGDNDRVITELTKIISK